LWKGGQDAIEASDDPLIQFVLRTDPLAREARTAYEARVAGPVDAAAEKIAKARFAVLGDSVYPDATFSLRLSYGKVAGWTGAGREPSQPYDHLRRLLRPGHRRRPVRRRAALG
jgi:hypothetical protein